MTVSGQGNDRPEGGSDNDPWEGQGPFELGGDLSNTEEEEPPTLGPKPQHQAQGLEEDAP